MSQAVLEVLGLWQDLQFATQQRYLETPDPDGENAFQLAVREALDTKERTPWGHV